MLYAFLSKQRPTLEHYRIAAQMGIELLWEKDFEVNNIDKKVDGVIVFTPIDALELIKKFDVGVFLSKTAVIADEPTYKPYFLKIYPKS